MDHHYLLLSGGRVKKGNENEIDRILCLSIESISLIDKSPEINPSLFSRPECEIENQTKNYSLERYERRKRIDMFGVSKRLVN